MQKNAEIGNLNVRMCLCRETNVNTTLIVNVPIVSVIKEHANATSPDPQSTIR